MPKRVPRWKLDKADWSLFENLCQAELQSKMFETVQDPILTFNTVLTSIADRTIPKTSANPKHPSKPWFDDACDQAIGDRKKSERLFNQQPTTENLSHFRIFCAKARRTYGQEEGKISKFCVEKNVTLIVSNKEKGFDARMLEEELNLEFEGLTEETVNDVMVLTGKEINLENVRMLLHFSILQAQANLVGAPKGKALRESSNALPRSSGSGSTEGFSFIASTSPTDKSTRYGVLIASTGLANTGVSLTSAGSAVSCSRLLTDTSNISGIDN
ncbi:Hypothetical predicted protein [Mytilus galloprovincialis]|uniref:Uncharacterized protein n=1 Tax=Mytilus galloprovincialis TaxID=29158 RepID=A0A8B6DNW9_MYTGA|nr:Hypothetical predicted protein [Mytilus galloprovincialis]